MLRRFRLLPPAEEEFRHVREYYDGESPGLGSTFAERVREAIAFAMERPEAGSPFLDRRIKHRVRKYRITKFRYDVVVLVEGDTLVVIAISPHRRKPGYWVRRLRSV